MGKHSRCQEGRIFCIPSPPSCTQRQELIVGLEKLLYKKRSVTALLPRIVQDKTRVHYFLQIQAGRIFDLLMSSNQKLPQLHPRLLAVLLFLRREASRMLDPQQRLQLVPRVRRQNR